MRDVSTKLKSQYLDYSFFSGKNSNHTLKKKQGSILCASVSYKCIIKVGYWKKVPIVRHFFSLVSIILRELNITNKKQLQQRQITPSGPSLSYPNFVIKTPSVINNSFSRSTHINQLFTLPH